MFGKWHAALALTVLSFVALCRVVAVADESHTAEVEEWRKGRMERLLAADGYLALVGLFWLDEGEHTFGSAEDNDLIFPAHSAPAHAGVLVRVGDATTVRAHSGTPLLHDGEPVTEMRLIPDSEDGTTELTLGELSFYLIQRGDRFGIRVIDPNSRIRKNFKGIQHYPVQESYRVVARFEPYDPPKEIPILSEVGTTSIEQSPGALVFELNGRECRLDPTVAGKRYFIVFRDLTSGEETYGSGRFLYADREVDGKVVLDFNEAYNPPCAFSPYTTCPLPPLQNELDVAVRAGEKALDASGKPFVK